MKLIVSLVLTCLCSFAAFAQVTFTNSSTPSVGGAPRSVASADVNGDGKTDLISANLLDATLSVLTNNGNGGFASAGTYAVGANPDAVIAADLNGDGKVDLISANGGSGGNTLTILTNNGSGGFVLASSPVVGNAVYSVTAADVNGDGMVDLISANASDNTLTVLTNNGNGNFMQSASLGVGSAPYSVAAADVNRDGKMDLVAASRDANTLTIFTNNGSGGFVLSSAQGVGGGPWWVAPVDVNGDGKVDLITANSVANTLTVLTNNGNGGFVIASSPGAGSEPFAVTPADVNGDGKVDLISPNFVGGNGNTLTVLTNNGNGGFALALSLVVGTGPVSVASVDVNSDGKADLISANYSANTLTVLTNFTSFPGSSLPIITTQPIGLTNLAGSTGSISIGATATGTEPARRLSYQWRLAGTNLLLATNNILPLPNLSASQAGNYDVVISNFVGSVTSSPAVVDLRLILVRINGLIPGGSITATGSVSVSVSGGYPGGFLFYTVDGSTPSSGSTVYAGPFTLTNSAVVQVMALSADFSQTAFATPVTVQIIPLYALQTSIVGSGTLTTNPATGPYVSNSVVTLTANAAPRFVFDHWAGDAAGSQNPLSVTMIAPRNIQAVFVQTAFPLTVSSPGGGSVTANGQVIAPATYYPTGSVVTLSAAANSGWSFLGWQGNASGTTNPLSITMNQTNNIQAIFGTAVSTNALGGSVVLSLPNPVPFGTVLSVSAIPDLGNYFSTWGGSLSGTNAPARLTVTNAVPAVSALFATLPGGKYSLSVVVNGNGYATNSPLRSYYNPGDSVTNRALTNAGALFFGWSRDASGTNNPLVITMNSNKVIQANFGVIPVVGLSPLNQTVLAGSNTTITATAAGVLPLAYQWQNAQGNLPNQTNPVLTFASTQPTNAGNYFVIVTNSFGAVTSVVATVTVIGAPVITNQPPALTTVTVGHGASFVAGAYGWPTLAYRWQFNGSVLNGATSNTFILANAFPANAGAYTLVITNIYGSVTSSPATLTVLPLGITGVKIPAAGQFQFSFDTASGVNYVVQYSTNLNQWLQLITVGGVGLPMTLTDPMGGNQNRFYRILLSPHRRTLWPMARGFSIQNSR